MTTQPTIPLRLVGLKPSINKRPIGYRWQVTARYSLGGKATRTTALGGWARNYRLASRATIAAKRTLVEEFNRDLRLTLRRAGEAS